MLFRIAIAPTFLLLRARRWLARRIEKGGALTELCCYIPWLIVSGLGITGLNIAKVLA